MATACPGRAAPQAFPRPSGGARIDSPLFRGNRFFIKLRRLWTVRKRQPTVYPRVCGGASRTEDATPPSRGLSPRVRGSRLLVGGLRRCDGSIPASAGEPT